MNEKRLIWIQFYPRDWLSDVDLRRCSIQARGLWIDILCLMSQGREFGRLVDGGGVALSVKQLADDCRITESEANSLLDELRARNVFSTDEEGVIVSRRMLREEKIRARNTKNGKKGGSPILKNNTLEVRDYRLESGLTVSVNPSVNPSPANLSINPPTLEDCQAAARPIGMRAEMVEAFFHYYNAQGWVKKGGMPLRSLSSALASWKATESNFRPSGGKAGEAATPAWKKLEILKDQVTKFTAQNPHPDRWTNEQREELKNKRAEIKRLESEMVK